jgi:hypothetical protein
MFMRRRRLLRTAAIGGGAYVAANKSAHRTAEEAQPGQQAQPHEDEQNERIASLEQQQAHRAPRDRGPASAGRPGAPGGGQEQPSGAVPSPSMLDQLNQLAILHRQGALTDPEFTAAKAKLLSG